jgi:electron transport complex protein RnfG
LSDPPAPSWAIRRDGGEFDQLTGASITPRAVIRGIRDTLTYYETHRDDVFAESDDGE